MSTMTSQRELLELLPDLLPPQGRWDEEDYLWLTDRSNWLIEFTDGYIEILPMPTRRHQAILRLLFLAFLDHLQSRGGDVFFAPLRLRLLQGRFREPDLLALLDKRDPRSQDRYWLGADFVLGVVSPDKPERDLVEKRREYAEAGIPKYWIVNPLRRRSRSWCWPIRWQCWRTRSMVSSVADSALRRGCSLRLASM